MKPKLKRKAEYSLCWLLAPRGVAPSGVWLRFRQPVSIADSSLARWDALCTSPSQCSDSRKPYACCQSLSSCVHQPCCLQESPVPSPPAVPPPLLSRSLRLEGRGTWRRPISGSVLLDLSLHQAIVLELCFHRMQ